MVQLPSLELSLQAGRAILGPGRWLRPVAPMSADARTRRARPSGPRESGRPSQRRAAQRRSDLPDPKPEALDKPRGPNQPAGRGGRVELCSVEGISPDPL